MLQTVTAPDQHSLASYVSSLSEGERDYLLSRLTETEAISLKWDWLFWARPEQVAPAGDWDVWLLEGGRGMGKTRTGAEYVRSRIESGDWRHVALVAATAADARDVIVEGESGLLRISPPWFMPNYEPSKRRLTWPNGAVATLYSAEKPTQLRGPQHDGAWCDELAKWRYPDAWDMLQFGLRSGSDPRAVVTTTPKAVKHYRSLRDEPGTVITGGSTYRNIENVSPRFIRSVVRRYEHTRLGQQELYATILDDVEGALWSRELLEMARVNKAPNFTRIVVAVDPQAGLSGETGIIVAALGEDGHGYVVDDPSISASPDTWGRAAVTAYYRHHADRIVAEANNGGDMVELTLRTVDRNVPYKKVWASRGKQARAEPVVALFEQGRIHMLGFFSGLEDELCSWVPGESESPNHLDALVWAITELMLSDNSPEQWAY